MVIKVRFIPGFKDRYAASKCGKIFKFIDGKFKLIQGHTDQSGYSRVKIDRKECRVHRLVALTYLGPSNGLEVNHKDFNRSNNHVSNLEYVTRKENIRHSREAGNYIGINLSDRAKDDIRILRETGLSNDSIHEILGLNHEVLQRF